MQLSQEQFNALIGVVILLGTAIAAYLNNQASQKRSTETQNKVDQLQTRVDDVHAAVTGSPPTVVKLVDGHELPFQKPPPAPLP